MASSVATNGSPATLSILTLVMLTTTQAQLTYTRNNNQHCPGGGLWPVSDPRHTASQVQCQAYCDADPTCVALLYHHSRTANQCWPKNTCPVPLVAHPSGTTYLNTRNGQPGTGTTVGTQQTSQGGTVGPASYLQVNNSHCPGGGLWPTSDPRHTATLDQCKQHCAANASCVAFLYLHARSTGNCWPKLACADYSTAHPSGHTFVKQVVRTGQSTSASANLPGRYSCYVCHWYDTEDIDYVRGSGLAASGQHTAAGRRRDCLEDPARLDRAASSVANCTFCTSVTVRNSLGNTVFVKKECASPSSSVPLQATHAAMGYRATRCVCQDGDFCNSAPARLLAPAMLYPALFMALLFI